MINLSHLPSFNPTQTSNHHTDPASTIFPHADHAFEYIQNSKKKQQEDEEHEPKMIKVKLMKNTLLKKEHVQTKQTNWL